MSNKKSYNAEIIGGDHGVTCIFPTLKDIIDYEERKRVPKQGYPRFITHPDVVSVQQKHKIYDLEVFAIQSPEAANYIRLHYFDSKTRENSFVQDCEHNKNRYGIIYVQKQYATQAGECITNTGVILSSRKARRILNDQKPPKKDKELAQLLSNLEKRSKPSLTYLYTSGMAAIFDAVKSYLKEGSRAVVIGNTYVDTRKIFQKLPERFHYKPTVFLKDGAEFSIPPSTSIVFLEIPSNPTLHVEDLENIVQQSHDKNAIVIVDSTIATPHHFSPFEYGADIVIHSTSKSLSGSNNHLGGVLFINPDHYKLARKILHKPFEMDNEEEITLKQSLSTFTGRIHRMARNAEKIADYLKQQPAVARVYYPTELKNGNGHIISFELENSDFQHAEAFYDHCSIPIKALSMGFEKTMLMPYTLITHYHDSDVELANLNLQRYLMRLSVGTEAPRQIIDQLATGLRALSLSAQSNI